jgi:hypothetical protein
VGTIVYHTLLNKLDLATGANSFWKAQVLEERTGAFGVFVKWGRVGQRSSKGAGGSKWMPDSDVYHNHGTGVHARQCAIAEFKKSFREKSANDWDVVMGLQEAKRGGGGVRMSDEEKVQQYGSFNFRGGCCSRSIYTLISHTLHTRSIVTITMCNPLLSLARLLRFRHSR